MATVQQDDPELQNLPHSSTLQLRAVPLPTANATLLCDMNIGTPRPYMPQPFRCAVFDVLHSLSHPGIRATQRLITTCYLWPSINADLRKSACSCLQCQRTKVHQHTFTPTGTFVMPDARFDHVHIDLLGLIPPCKAYLYLLTCVDWFTRWPKAFSLPDITASTVAQTFVSGWTACCGVPSTITTDHGAQFESDVWHQLMCLLGTTHIRTTAYHPAAHGLIERLHRQLKAGLSTMTQTHWVDTLPLLLLGIRSSLKEDLCCTATKLVYSTTLRLPGEFFDTTETHSVPDPQHYVTRLRHSMQLLLPVPTANHSCSKPHCFHFHFILQTAAATLTCSENGTLLCPNDCFIATSLSDCSDSESSSWLSFDSAIQNAIFKYNSHYNARNYHMNNFNLSL